ncbi:hypothetical protein HXX76_012112 [Chlamydomonas incerta]|uniref:Uncharacterized protein n=1 Tax=Chlamydomonas incerta TaxID=51695 RepID=A0A835SML2_CHLIN|nr:hypothetical protein HXX76_012112 [Chlamydomonas incerta]|eukprot:KAG2427787.1 hypothetical protein HXX76_012112 [Chlamydomonas incerta]
MRVTRSGRAPTGLSLAALLLALVALAAVGSAGASRPTSEAEGNTDRGHAQPQPQHQPREDDQAGAVFRAAAAGSAAAAGGPASGNAAAAEDGPRRRLHWGCRLPGATCTYTSETLRGKTSVTVSGGPARGAKPPAPKPPPPPPPAPGPSTLLVRPPPQTVVVNINNYDKDGKLKYTNSTVSTVPAARAAKPPAASASAAPDDTAGLGSALAAGRRQLRQFWRCHPLFGGCDVQVTVTSSGNSVSRNIVVTPSAGGGGVGGAPKPSGPPAPKPAAPKPPAGKQQIIVLPAPPAVVVNINNFDGSTVNAPAPPPTVSVGSAPPAPKPSQG